MKIEIVSGSSRKESLTHRVALHLEKMLKEVSDHDIHVIDLRENFLPPLQRVFNTPKESSSELRQVAESMFEADAYILVSPEYNGSYPASLKNLMDHFPKRQHKTFGIVTASPGPLGGIRAALQLQQLVFALFGIGSPFMLITPGVDKKFDGQGNLLDPSFEKNVQTFIQEFLWLAEKIVEAEMPVAR